MIPQPYVKELRRSGSTYFEWKIEDYPDGVNNGDYFVRGSVCWPMMAESGDSFGHAICAIQRVSSRRVIVMADTKFVSVDNIIEDSRIVSIGLAKWFSSVWSVYGCDTFFWSGSQSTHKQHLLQVVRSQAIQPKPWFPEVDLHSIDDAASILFSMKSKGLLMVDDNSQIVKDVLLWQQAGRPDRMPSVVALMTLVNGYERFPFRPNVET